MFTLPTLWVGVYFEKGEYIMKDTKMMIDTFESSINIFSDSSFYYKKEEDAYYCNAGTIITIGDRVVFKSVSENFGAYNADAAEIVAVLIGLEEFYKAIENTSIVLDKDKKYNVQVFIDNINAKNSIEEVLNIKYTRHYNGKLNEVIKYSIPDLNRIKRILEKIRNRIDFSIDFVYVPAHSGDAYNEDITFTKFVKHNVEYVSKHNNKCTGLLHKFLKNIINLNEQVDTMIRISTYQFSY